MKKTFILIFFLTGFILTGCNLIKKEELPEGILSQEKFVEVLKDCQLAEASIYMHKMKQPDSGPYTKHMYKAIFTKHHITEDQFRKNIDFYKSKPEELLKIYSNLVDSLNKMQSMLNHGKKLD